jgi:hypothetical protein
MPKPTPETTPKPIPIANNQDGVSPAIIAGVAVGGVLVVGSATVLLTQLFKPTGIIQTKLKTKITRPIVKQLLQVEIDWPRKVPYPTKTTYPIKTGIQHTEGSQV